MLYISEFWIVLGTVYKYCWGTVVFFGLSLGQCTSIVGGTIVFLDCLWDSVPALLGTIVFLDCLWDSVQALLGTIVFWIVFGTVYKHCWGTIVFLDCLWDSVQALLGHNYFFGLSLGQCTSIVGSQLLNHRAGWCWCDGLRFLLGCVCDIY